MQRRKFHEALINMLYPPPPATSIIKERKEDDEATNIEPLPDEIPDDKEKSFSDGGDGKLTRSQRKRLRKRKLKEDSVRRGKMIGPLLPVTIEEAEPEGVQPNVSMKIQRDETGEVGKNKVKQRRRVRKLAKTLPESADVESLNVVVGGGGEGSH